MTTITIVCQKAYRDIWRIARRFFEGEAVRGTSPQVVFGLDDGGIDTAVEALAAQGVQLLTPVTEAPGGWSVEFKDPDGHPLAYFQDEALPRTLSS